METASSQKVSVTVTLAPDLRQRLDDLAERQDRSRSWLTGEAIRRYLAEAEAAQPERGT